MAKRKKGYRRVYDEGTGKTKLGRRKEVDVYRPFTNVGKTLVKDITYKSEDSPRVKYTEREVTRRNKDGSVKSYKNIVRKNGKIVNEATTKKIKYKDGGPKVKQRRGVRENPDGSVSSHLMRAEYIPERGWVGFPSLFQDSKPYADDQQNWVDMSETPDEDWMKIYEEAERRGEVYDFGEDKEAALAFGRGSWKDQLPDEGIELELTDEEVEQYKAGGYVLEELVEGGEDDIIRPHGDSYEYKKVGNKYYARKREGEWEGEGQPGWDLASGKIEDAIKYRVFKEAKPVVKKESTNTYDYYDQSNYQARYNNEMKLDQNSESTSNNYYQAPLLNLNGTDPDAGYNQWIANKPVPKRASSWFDKNVIEPVGDLYDKFQKTSLGPIDDAANLINDVLVQPVVTLATDTYNDPNKVAGEVLQMMVDGVQAPSKILAESIYTDFINPEAEFDWNNIGSEKSLQRAVEIATVLPMVPNVFGTATKTARTVNAVDDVVTAGTKSFLPTTVKALPSRNIKYIPEELLPFKQSELSSQFQNKNIAAVFGDEAKAAKTSNLSKERISEDFVKNDRSFTVIKSDRLKRFKEQQDDLSEFALDFNTIWMEGDLSNKTKRITGDLRKLLNEQKQLNKTGRVAYDKVRKIKSTSNWKVSDYETKVFTSLKGGYVPSDSVIEAEKMLKQLKSEMGTVKSLERKKHYEAAISKVEKHIVEFKNDIPKEVVKSKHGDLNLVPEDSWFLEDNSKSFRILKEDIRKARTDINLEKAATKYDNRAIPLDAEISEAAKEVDIFNILEPDVRKRIQRLKQTYDSPPSNTGIINTLETRGTLGKVNADGYKTSALVEGRAGDASLKGTNLEGYSQKSIDEINGQVRSSRAVIKRGDPLKIRVEDPVKEYRSQVRGTDDELERIYEVWSKDENPVLEGYVDYTRNIYRKPKELAGTVGHEDRHIYQNIMGYLEPYAEYVDEFAYTTTKLDNKTGKTLSQIMKDPKPKSASNYDFETWLSSPKELDANLASERIKFAWSKYTQAKQAKPNATTEELIKSVVKEMKLPENRKKFIEDLMTSPEGNSVQQHFKSRYRGPINVADDSQAVTSRKQFVRDFLDSLPIIIIALGLESSMLNDEPSSGKIKRLGGSIEAELTDKEAQMYANGGYVLEELPSYAPGGANDPGNPLSDWANQQASLWSNLNETDPEGRALATSYFSNIGDNYNLGLIQKGKMPHWSAATVSNAVMANIGATDKETSQILGFNPTASHSGYIRDAFKTSDNPEYKYNRYVAEGVGDSDYGIGDILVKGRSGTKNWKYGDFKKANDSYESHGDIIVDKGEDDKGAFVVLAGGNLSDTYKNKKVYVNNLKNNYTVQLTDAKKGQRRYSSSQKSDNLGEDSTISETGNSPFANNFDWNIDNDQSSEDIIEQTQFPISSFDNSSKLVNSNQQALFGTDTLGIGYIPYQYQFPDYLGRPKNDDPYITDEDVSISNSINQNEINKVDDTKTNDVDKTDVILSDDIELTEEQLLTNKAKEIQKLGPLSMFSIDKLKELVDPENASKLTSENPTVKNELSLLKKSGEARDKRLEKGDVWISYNNPEPYMQTPGWLEAQKSKFWTDPITGEKKKIKSHNPYSIVGPMMDAESDKQMIKSLGKYYGDGSNKYGEWLNADEVAKMERGSAKSNAWRDNPTMQNSGASEGFYHNWWEDVLTASTPIFSAANYIAEKAGLWDDTDQDRPPVYGNIFKDVKKNPQRYSEVKPEIKSNQKGFIESLPDIGKNISEWPISKKLNYWWDNFEDGGYVVDLNEDEVNQYAQRGYIVEEIK